MTHSLKANLISLENYIMGRDINVTLSILNQGTENITIHKPLTAKGDLMYNLFNIKQNGKEIPYHGAIFLSVDNNLTLEPRDSLSFDVNVAREYPLQDAGAYSLELDQSTLLYNEDITSEKVKTSFNLCFKEEAPLLTHYQISSLKYKAIKASANYSNNFSIYGARNKQEIQDTKDAHIGAENILLHILKQSVCNSAISSIPTWNLQPIHCPLPNDFAPRYSQMFCSNNQQDWEAILGKYTSIYNYMEVGMQYWHGGNMCAKGIFGYILTADKGKNVFLCDAYSQSPTLPDKGTPYDSKAGVIIHEVSHKAIDSKDHYYSYARCKHNAAICDNSTIENADCIQMFAELVYVDSIP